MATEHEVDPEAEQPEVDAAGQPAASWYLIQYTADLRKREQRNVGVALRTPDETWHARFFGEVEPGKVNGHRLRGLHLLKEPYEAWIAYYRRKMDEDRWSDVVRAHSRRTANFATTVGGQISGGHDTDWGSRVTELFNDLVGEPHAALGLSVGEQMKARAAELFDLAQVAVERDFRTPARFGINANQVEVPFDFTFVNGQRHLAHTVSVGGWAGRNAALAFNAQAKAVRAAGGGSSFIAFYDSHQVEEKDEELILAALEGEAHTIDITETDEAVDVLRELAHHE